MDRMLVASAVAESLFTTEAAVEDTLATAVRLMQQLMEARRALGLPLATGDPVLTRVSATVTALGVAHREIVRAHQEIEVLAGDLGLSGIAFGPLIKPRGAAMEPEPAD